LDIDPDNYTDPPTFLSHLQRNPRLQLYDFWPLVANSTVIVQHICSVAIFVCCFVGISQDRISPVSVVSLGSTGTVLGWVLWDFCIGQEAARTITETTTGPSQVPFGDANSGASSALGNTTPISQGKEPPGVGLGLTLETDNLRRTRGHSHSLRWKSKYTGPVLCAKLPFLKTKSATTCDSKVCRADILCTTRLEPHTQIFDKVHE